MIKLGRLEWEDIIILTYVYVLDTMADWELGHVTAELNSKRFFKKDAPDIVCKTFALTKEPVKTMGGMTILPDCTLEDVALGDTNVMILPGANTWNEPKHAPVVQKADAMLKSGGTVCAICGATLALADAGLLNVREHTSNGPSFLETFSSTYKGKQLYVDEPSVSSGGLITAGSAAALLWAKQIIEHLGVFNDDTLEAWYEYFVTGKPESFFRLLGTLEGNN